MQKFTWEALSLGSLLSSSDAPSPTRYAPEAAGLLVPRVLWAGGRADQVVQGTALRLRAGTGLIPLSSLVTEGILLGGMGGNGGLSRLRIAVD